MSPAEASGATGLAVYLVPQGGGANLLVGTLVLKAPTTTPSPEADGGPLVIQGIFGVPNPNPDWLVVELTAPVDGLEVKVFTKAMVLAAHFEAGGMKAGWNKVPVQPGFKDLPNDLYYVVAEARRGNAVSQSRFAKLFILR